MKLIEFTDFNDRGIAVRQDLISHVEKPGSGVHDYGSLKVLNGTTYFFRDGHTAQRIIQELLEN